MTECPGMFAGAMKQMVSCVTKGEGERMGSPGIGVQCGETLQRHRGNPHFIHRSSSKGLCPCHPSLGGRARAVPLISQGPPQRRVGGLPKVTLTVRGGRAKETPRKDLEPKRIWTWKQMGKPAREPSEVERLTQEAVAKDNGWK